MPRTEYEERVECVAEAIYNVGQQPAYESDEFMDWFRKTARAAIAANDSFTEARYSQAESPESHDTSSDS